VHGGHKERSVHPGFAGCMKRGKPHHMFAQLFFQLQKIAHLHIQKYINYLHQNPELHSSPFQAVPMQACDNDSGW
jgi:hypothetical protein